MGTSVSSAVQVTTVGDTVTLKKDKDTLAGVVRFIGPIKGKDGVFYGVELNELKGQNNGSLAENKAKSKSHFYFPKVEDKKGLFIRSKRIESTNYKYNKAKRVTVGDKVKVVKSDCNGTIKWIGTPEFSDKGKYYGIELEKPKGKTNGTVKNKWYFTCQNKHATFVQETGFELLTETLETNQEPKTSKVTKLIDYYDSKSTKPACTKAPTPKKAVKRKSVTLDKKITQNKITAEDKSVQQLLKHLTKQVEALNDDSKKDKSRSTLTVCMMCLAVLIVLTGIAFGTLKGYYINDQFETAMTCYNFMTFSKPKYLIVEFLMFLINQYSEDTIIQINTNNLPTINYQHSYNQLKFQASAIGIEGLELSSGKQELDGVLINYKCDSGTRNEILNLSYKEYKKSTINIDRSKAGEIEVHYLRIFISKTGKNEYLTYCGFAHAIYNFKDDITKDQIQAIVENDAVPSFKKDMAKPIWGDIIKQNV